MNYRDDSASLRARVAELESENAVLRAGQTPAPTGPKRWTMNLRRPVAWWQGLLMHAICIANSTAHGTRWHWPVLLCGLVVWFLSCVRREHTR